MRQVNREVSTEGRSFTNLKTHILSLVGLYTSTMRNLLTDFVQSGCASRAPCAARGSFIHYWLVATNQFCHLLFHRISAGGAVSDIVLVRYNLHGFRDEAVGLHLLESFIAARDPNKYCPEQIVLSADPRHLVRPSSITTLRA